MILKILMSLNPKNIKLAVLQFLKTRVSQSYRITRRTPITFTNNELAEEINCYKISATRELREIKNKGLIGLQVIDRLGGKYQLELIEDTIWTKEKFVVMLNKAEEILNFESRKSITFDIKQILNGIHRDLPEIRSDIKKSSGS